jgi:RimJ/RimL family protein N-acetyltransferase
MLETPRLILRPFKETDGEAAHRWFRDPDVFRFYTYGPYSSLHETTERIRQYIEHFEKFGYAKYVVIEKSSRVPIGDAGLSFDADIGVTVGYKFARSHWGKGYATEAAQACVTYGFERLDLERIGAIIHPLNTKSQRVIEKLQFSLSTSTREGDIDWQIYRRLRMEYERDSIKEEQLRRATIGEPRIINSSISVVDYDPVWPALYRAEAHRIHAALGARVLRLEHVGSTAIPGLAAKPIIDMLLVVADTSDEASYVPAIESAGYVLRVREPDWHEHRLFKGPHNEINLHCFSAKCPEVERIVPQTFAGHIARRSSLCYSIAEVNDLQVQPWNRLPGGRRCPNRPPIKRENHPRFIHEPLLEGWFLTPILASKGFSCITEVGQIRLR